MKKQSTLMQLCMMLLMAMLSTTVRAEVVPFTENYSAESTTEGWTSSVQGDNPRFTPIIYNEAELLPGRGLDNNYFLSVNQSERNNNGCIVTGTILSGKAAAGDDFTLEFDMKLCNSNNNRSSQSPVSLQIKDANNEKDIFSLSAPEKYVSTWNVNGTDLQVTLPETGGMGIASLTWCHYVIARSGNLTYLTITNNATGETVLERTLIEGSSETGGLGNIVFTTKRYYANFAIDNIVVRALEESDVPSGEMSSYTIKYRNEGGYEIKPDIVTPFIVGNEATATAEQMAPIYYNDKKYLYKEGNNTITLVADASQNVITLVYREAQQCNYTVKAIYGDKEKVLVEGKGIEGDAVTYNYPKYMLDGTTLYLKNQSATNPYFGKTITLSEENTIETVEYTDGAASDVVFYKEAEQMEGFTSLTTTNADIRCSDGKGGVIDGDEPVVLTTLPAGKYVIYGQVWGTAGYTATITADNATVWELASTGYLFDALSEEITLTKETTLYIKDSGDDEMRHKMLDLIYIQEAKQHYIAEYDRDASSLTFKKGILPLGSTTVWDAENTGSEPGWLSRIPYVTNVLFEESFADARPTSCALWFKGASKLTTITGLEYLNTSEVTSMSEMFRNCQQLTSLDLSTFYTKNVTDMYYMFYNDYRLTSLNVSSFNTAKVENMGLMFGYCSQLTSLDVSSFNTDAAVTVSGMFYYCSALKTIYSENSWSLPSLQDGGGNWMFYGCQNLVGGSGTVYDEEHTGAEYARIDGDMLGYFTKIGYVAEYNATDNTLTFKKGIVPSGSATVWDVISTTYSPGWSDQMENITKVIFDESFVEARPLSLARWFSGASNLSSIIGIENLNTECVTDMSLMFYSCVNLTELDLSHFNTAKVTKMAEMFFGCQNLTKIYVSNEWTTANVEDNTYFNQGDIMFIGCLKLLGGKGTGYDKNHIDISFARIDGGVETPGYLTDIADKGIPYTEAYVALTEENTVLTFYYDDKKEDRNGLSYFPAIPNERPWEKYASTVEKVVFDASFASVNNLQKTSRWFMNFGKLAIITGLEHLNTESVTSMSSMFYGCTSLTNLDLRSFNTDNVTDMDSMFGECRQLLSLNLSSFNTSKVSSMYQMFYCCSSLKSLNLNSFNTENVDLMGYMFYGCSQLPELNLSNFNTEKVVFMSYMFRGCTTLRTLDLSSFNTSAVKYTEYMFGNNAKLETIYAGEGWDMQQVEASGNMFYYCNSLKGGKGTVYDAEHTDAEYARIDGGAGAPGYFTDKVATGINNINQDVKGENIYIYNLKGERLSSPRSGINIVGGRKVIVK